MTDLLPVNNLEEARKACGRYLERHGPIAAPNVAALMSSERFTNLVARVERGVTGEHALHALDSAMDEAVTWTLGVVGSLPMSIQREILFGNEPIAFQHGSFGI